MEGGREGRYGGMKHLSITSCLLTGFKMSGTRETKISTDVSRRPVPQNEKRIKKKKRNQNNWRKAFKDGHLHLAHQYRTPRIG